MFFQTESAMQPKSRFCTACGLAVLLVLGGCGGGSWFGWNSLGTSAEDRAIAKKRKQFPTDIPMARDVGLNVPR